MTKVYFKTEDASGDIVERSGVITARNGDLVMIDTGKDRPIVIHKDEIVGEV